MEDFNFNDFNKIDTNILYNLSTSSPIIYRIYSEYCNNSITKEEALSLAVEMLYQQCETYKDVAMGTYSMKYSMK
jgi:hypothetical protein